MVQPVTVCEVWQREPERDVHRHRCAAWPVPRGRGRPHRWRNRLWRLAESRRAELPGGRGPQAQRRQRAARHHRAPSRIAVAVAVRLSVLLFAVLASTATTSAQPQADDRATVVLPGRVLSDDAMPVRGARIHLLSEPSAAEPAMSDDNGHFEMRVPAQRALRIRIAKAGFVTQIVTSSRAPGQLAVTLPRAAVLTGQVLSASGEPLVANVSVERSDAGEQPVGTRSFFVTQTSTNDLGEFRLSGLPAGQYRVKSLAFQSSVSLQRGEESSLAIVRA